MERAPWFLDPEVLMFGQVAGIAAFVVALALTLIRRKIAEFLPWRGNFSGKVRKPEAA